MYLTGIKKGKMKGSEGSQNVKKERFIEPGLGNECWKKRQKENMTVARRRIFGHGDGKPIALSIKSRDGS